MISCLSAYMTQMAAVMEQADRTGRRSLRSLFGFPPSAAARKAR